MRNCRALLRLLRQLTYILTKKQKRESVKVFFAIIVCSIMELVGVTAVYPILEAMVDGDAIKEKWYIRWLFLKWPNTTVATALIVMGIIIILVYIIKNAVALFGIYIQHKFASAFLRESATTMLDSYLKRPYEYFVNTNSSIILRGINSDTAAVYEILISFFQIIAESLTVALIGVFLFVSDWIIAVGAVFLALICLLSIVLGFKQRIKEIGRKSRDSEADKSAVSYQAVWGIKEISVLGRRRFFVEKFEKLAKITEKYNTSRSIYQACPNRIIEAVCISGFMAIICIRISLDSNYLSFIPVMGAFAMGAFKILPSVAKISERINSLVLNQFGLQGCYDIISEAREIDYQQNELSNTSIIYSDKKNISDDLHFTNNIVVSSVDWQYVNSDTKILSDVTLTINKGESIAFIGPSGSGKTTLADIILGLLKPQKGTVEMDGVDIFSIQDQWTRIVGYVPQSVFLTDDTIRANVAFGLPEEIISDEKVWNALKEAQLYEHIKNLPLGLNTIVGERGIKLSGGQRQRIAIARALYTNPDIIVFDEATSALDTETEKAVMESIDSLKGCKTMIIIAHRLSTIRNCDRIYRIEAGKAVELEKQELHNKADD